MTLLLVLESQTSIEDEISALLHLLTVSSTDNAKTCAAIALRLQQAVLQKQSQPPHIAELDRIFQDGRNDLMAPSYTAEDVARHIVDDLTKLCAVRSQRQRYRLGELLLAPLPFSTLDSTTRQPGEPAFANELLHYEGEDSNFSTILDRSKCAPEQLNHVIAVTQASGSGKTKLAYAQGTKSSLMVIIRVVGQNGTFLPAWQAYLAMAEGWATACPKLSAANRKVLAENALAALRLLVVTYVQWVKDVLAAAVPLLEELSLQPEDRAAMCRQIALRCLRNNRGDAAAFLGFETALRKHASSCQLDEVSVLLVDCDAIAALAKQLNADLLDLLWPEAQVVVWYDEVQQLEGQATIFLRLSQYTAEHEAGTSSQDLLYALTALTAWFTDKLRWRQVLCGPWLELSDRLKVQEYSCIHNRVTVVHHASVITLPMMLVSLQRYLAVEVEKLSAAAKAALATLCGRPVWFFDEFWTSLILHLKRQPEFLVGNQEALRGCIEAAAKYAVKAAQERAYATVEAAWRSTRELGAGYSISRLCKELYIALKFNGGLVHILKDAVGVAIRCGLLALQPGQDTDVDLRHNEPILAAAIEHYGDGVVCRAYTMPTEADSINPDPVYWTFSNYLSSGSIGDLQLTTSVKGPTLELLFAWHVVRCCTRGGHGMASLQAIFRPLVSDSFELPATFANRYVRARYVQRAASVPGAHATSFHALLAAGRDVVLVGIDVDAGADVLLTTTDETGEQLGIVLVQAKAQKDTRLLDSLRACSPAWQHTNQPQRDWIEGKGKKGKKKDGSLNDKRLAFDELVAGHPQLFEEAVRVVLTVGDYQSRTVKRCNKLNSDVRFARSPIVLCRTAALAFGGGAQETLVQSCSGDDGVCKPVQDTGNLFYWWPHAASLISAACADGGKRAELRRNVEKYEKEVFADDNL